MPDEDLTQWPTIDQAAALLQTSIRSIWRHNENGKLEMRKRPRPGKKPENVVRPEDLEKLKPQPYPVRMPPPGPAAGEIAPPLQFHPDAFAFTVPALKGEQIDRFLDALRDMTAPRLLPPPPEPAARPEPAAVALERKLCLTIPEAAVYSGVSSGKIRQAIKDGRLPARPDGPRGAIIIARAKLEEFAQ